MNRASLIVTILVGVGLATVTAIQARSLGAPPPAPEVDAAAAAVRRSVAAEGRLTAYPGAEVRVAAERAGRVIRVLVQEGQAVKKGVLLAEIESDELRAALAESEARLVEARAQADMAELTMGRRRKLAGEGVLSSHDLDQARHDLEGAQARIATGQAEIERTRAQLAKSRVLAPIAGTVTARAVDGGETVETGSALFTVADLGRVRVEAEADEADAALLALGAPVEVTAQGWAGRTWRGRIEEVADAVTPRKLKPQDPSRPSDTRVLALKVAFTEPTPLKLGATVELRIQPVAETAR
jgi:HlyD family secretion protein